jgi:hypothetical protein
MPMYRLHVEAVYSFDFPVEAENEEAATKLFEDMSEEDLFAFIDVGEEPDEYVLVKVEVDTEAPHALIEDKE